MSIQSSAKCKIHVIICYLVGKIPVEVHNEVKTTYGNQAMYCGGVASLGTVVCLCRSGRLSIVTDKIVEKIENVLRDNHRLTVDELSAMFPQISRSLLYKTITKTLGYWKLSVRWVPKQLTDQHKFNQVEAGQEFFEVLQTPWR